MTGKHPRLRSHTRRRKSGKVVTYYVYDRRPEGLPDVPLGSDFGDAVKRWDELHNQAPRIAGTLEEAFGRWEREILPTHREVTREGYARHLKRLRPVFGSATWDSVELQHLVGYLAARSAKTQGNREMALLSIVWNKARLWGLTSLPYPAAGMQRSRWKNPEAPRRLQVTDELFQAVYAEADPVLRDCMDLSTATGLRLTDCRTMALPRGDVLTVKASKTGKQSDFDVSLSAILPDLLARRRALLKAAHTMLLSTPAGQPVTARMLRDRWDLAREEAARKAEAAGYSDLAEAVRGLYLRDMRKRASDLAGSDEEARDLLDHSTVGLTKRHYRTVVKIKRPVR